MNKAFKQVESEIFDCEYFKGIYMSDYEEGKDDLSIVKTVYSRLKKRKCTDEDPFIIELKERYQVLAAASNAEKRDEFDANNPAVVAKKRYDGGDYTVAIEKWEEAIAAETDPNKQATYLFRIASTQGRKLKQYAKARTTARKAAKLRPNWGRPFMLIGDLYASSARRCGDDWNQRLAILAAIDKYSYAKSLDPEVAEEASRRIGKYNQSRPEKADGFSRGINEGSSQTVGCWIGESVKVRFK
jgi:tetratricopeptide (TPR) repeat protein